MPSVYDIETMVGKALSGNLACRRDLWDALTGGVEPADNGDRYDIVISSSGNYYAMDVYVIGADGERRKSPLNLMRGKASGWVGVFIDGLL